MTIQEKIKYIVQNRFINDEVKGACIEALDKQIPKKPIGDLHSVPHYRCPICQFGIVMYEESIKYPYCHHCGQAIQWEG